MATELDYMKFALNVYGASNKNLIGVPFGWRRTHWQEDTAFGFSAGCFVNGSEMVIAYTGTNDKVTDVPWGLQADQVVSFSETYTEASYHERSGVGT